MSVALSLALVIAATVLVVVVRRADLDRCDGSRIGLDRLLAVIRGLHPARANSERT